jgi:predicted ATPase
MTQIISKIQFFQGRERVDGLSEFSMDRLGDVVILAGPNGSGKTRILRALQSAIKTHTATRNEILELIDQIEIQSSPEYRKPEGPSATNILESSRQQLAQYVQLSFQKSYSKGEPSLLSIYPRDNFQFTDPSTSSELHRREVKKDANYRYDFVPPLEDALIRVDIAVRDFFVASHHNSHIQEDERRRRTLRYNDLRDTLEKNVGALLAFDHDFYATLNGELLFQATEKFSSGQKKLVDFISALDSKSIISNDTIILIDEPELYIHSGALIQMLDRLRSAFTRSQLFIATHCVPLIAHLKHDNVWWVSQGKATYSGRNTQQVLEGLLGGAENVDKVRELTQEPSRFATLTYAYESLFPPDALPHHKADPQGQQISDAIRSTREQLGRPIRLLDYGAGKGRLVYALFEDLGASFEDFIDYVAFEPNPALEEECRQSILKAGKSRAQRLFSKGAALASAFERGHFDTVLLCNVLHEISPKLWMATFREIDRLLGPAGSVLIVEDKYIPHGEMAHSEGFIITDGRALKLLFRMPALPEMRSSKDPRYKERLFAYSIPKQQLSNIDGASVKEALEWCKAQSLREIVDLRSKPNDQYADGVLHGLWTQQFVNASIALERT